MASIKATERQRDGALPSRGFVGAGVQPGAIWVENKGQQSNPLGDADGKVQATASRHSR